MIFHTFRRDYDGNLYVRYLNWCDDRWDWSYNWLDNDWNDNEPALLRANLFISPSFLNGGVLFFKLAVPTAEHFSNFEKR